MPLAGFGFTKLPPNCQISRKKKTGKETSQSVISSSVNSVRI